MFWNPVYNFAIGHFEVESDFEIANFKYPKLHITRGHTFSRVQPFYEWAMSDLDKSMHISLWVKVAHTSFIEGSHMTKNTASVAY
jgi:hypothetical protein